MPGKGRGVMPPAYDFKDPNLDKQTCHVMLVHPKGHHDQDMDGGWTCQFCVGGLSACTVCGGFEGTLTRQCPGREMTEQELDAVYSQDLEFINNRWYIEKEDPS